MARLKDVRGASAATAICGGRTRSVSPLELDFPLNPMDLVIQALHFAGEFVDGLDEVLDDIVVGALLLRFAKKDLCLGGSLPHGDPNRIKLAGIHEASSNSCCKILTTGRLSWESEQPGCRKSGITCAKPGTFNQALGLPGRRPVCRPSTGAASQESHIMCDYSLHLMASRPAKVADKLISTDFVTSLTRGFSEVGQPEVAVCLLPGTEVAFDQPVHYDRAFSMFGRARIDERVARFRQVNMDDPHVHHDALEFPGGQIVMVTRLVPGQTATVLQLPAVSQGHGELNPREATPDGASREPETIA